MRGARGLTVTLAALLLAALGIAHTAADSKQVTPVPKPAAAGGGGQKWAVIVGVSDYDDPAIPGLGYSADDARAVYEILTDPQRGGYRPSNVRLLVSGASDPGNRPTRRNIMGRVEVFLSQAGPGDAVLFYFSGHGIEHQEQGYLLPSDAESGPLLPQFAVSLDFLNHSLAVNGASQKIVLLDACYSGVGKGIGEGMGAAFAQSLFASADGRVTLASCGPAEQSYEWPDRSASVFTHYLCDGLSGKADYDSDRSVSLTELHRYVSEQVRRWAADRNKQQNPRMQADVSGEIVLARVLQQAAAPPAPEPRPLVTTATLHVASDPAGAQVMVDGVARGTTPCDVEVDLGATQSEQVEVVVQKEGYKSQGARITLLRGQTSRWEDVGLESLPKPPPSQPLPVTPPPSRRPAAGLDLTKLAWPTSCLRTITGGGGSVQSVAFSMDGALLAGGMQDTTVRVWEVRNGHSVRVLRGHGGYIHSVAFSPDGRLASGGDDDVVMVWDVRAGRLALELRRHTADVTSVSFGSGGLTLLSSGDQTVKLSSARSGAPMKTFAGHNGWVYYAALTPDDALVGSGGFDDTVRLWDVLTGQCVSVLSGHAGIVRCVAFSPDGRLLASASDDQTLRLWDVGKRHCLRVLAGHQGPVESVAFHPSGLVLASGAWDDTVKLWDAANGQCLSTLGGHERRVHSVAFSLDGRLLASASEDGVVRLWQMPKELWVR
jgi:WD40 repeat protein/uncharacterized caspase-like protein